MKTPTLAACLAFLACAHTTSAPSGPKDSLEPDVTAFTTALLQADEATLKKYLAEGVQLPELPKSKELAALSVLKVCIQGSNAENTRKNVLVLISGDPSGLIVGVDEVATKDKDSTGWKISYVQLSTGEGGRPKAYLKNCEIDPLFLRQ